MYFIIDPDTNTVVAGTAGTGRPNFSLDDVEAYLTAEPNTREER
jgi:hypothetical protein